MDLQSIENEALHLPRQERAKLVQKLVLSLETSSEDELKEEWLRVAEKRARELDDGSLAAISESDVIRKARALLK